MAVQEDQITMRRFMDLSRQADRRGFIVYSNFLNSNEINLLHQCEKDLYTDFSLYGGYQGAERQMVAFQPDALCYNLDYPISCIRITPTNKRYAEQLSHRDILGALMHLGIERSQIGDILLQDGTAYVFSTEGISEFIIRELFRIRHTQVLTENVEPADFQIEIRYREENSVVASNRLDAFVASACKLSRSQASAYILSENVFINGKLITNHNQGLESGDIISLRGYGKVVFDAVMNTTKKGRIRISYRWYE